MHRPLDRSPQQNAAVLVLCTVDNYARAASIARILVEEKLAACVQVSAIESWYRWQGEVDHAPEQRLHIKTIAARTAEVESRVRALHGYDLPEIVTVPIGGADDYLAWIAESVASGEA